MNVVLKYKKENYFLDALLILRFVPPFDKLTMMQIKVYARLLYHYYDNERLTKEEREERIFGYDIRRLIQDELNINDSVFRNCLSALRRVGIIEKCKLIDRFILKSGNSVFIEFKGQSNGSGKNL